MEQQHWKSIKILLIWRKNINNDDLIATGGTAEAGAKLVENV